MNEKCPMVVNTVNMTGSKITLEPNLGMSGKEFPDYVSQCRKISTFPCSGLPKGVMKLSTTLISLLPDCGCNVTVPDSCCDALPAGHDGLLSETLSRNKPLPSCLCFCRILCCRNVFVRYFVAVTGRIPSTVPTGCLPTLSFQQLQLFEEVLELPGIEDLTGGSRPPGMSLEGSCLSPPLLH